MNTPKKYRLRIGDKIVGWEKNTLVVPTKSWFGGCWPHCEWYYSQDGKSWSKDYIVHGDKDQFTGLCDKKGVEGYHKDICELGGFYLLDNPRITRCTIEWDKGAFYLQPIGTDQHWSIQLLVGAEIISKDLLEEKT